MSDEIKVSGASRRERYLKILEKGDMHITWEVYGHGDDERDMETILVVSKDEFAPIKVRFGFPEATPILEVLVEISNSGRGDQFIDELFSGTIPLKEKFVF